MDIQLQFIEHDTFPALLKNGALDLVYTLNPIIENPELKMIHKEKEALAFFARPDHPIAKKKKVKREGSGGNPSFTDISQLQFQAHALEDFMDHQITPKIELETSSKEILKQFAINGLGIAFMPSMVATEEVRSGVLKKIDWAGDDFPIYSQMFIHKDKHLNKAMSELIKLIVEE